MPRMCRCEENHAPSELSIEDTQHLPGVELVPDAAFLGKSLFQNMQHKQADCSGSPFATPLVLRDDMQTPGTIYTSQRGASMSGKHVQTRKQFIYPVLRPIENRLQKSEDGSDRRFFNIATIQSCQKERFGSRLCQEAKANIFDFSG